MLENPQAELTSHTTEDVAAQDVIGVLKTRLTTTIDLTAATARLAVAETKLAVSSGALIIVCLVMLSIMILITWMVALATAFAALQLLGLTTLASLSCLLILQLLICAAIVYAMLKLRKNLSFPLTRQALRQAIPDNTQQETKNHANQRNQTRTFEESGK
jgi:Ca2+/Na+ antiporter